MPKGTKDIAGSIARVREVQKKIRQAALQLAKEKEKANNSKNTPK